MKLLLNKKKIFNIYILIYIIISIVLSRNTMITANIIGFKKSSLVCMILAIPAYMAFTLKIINKDIDKKKLSLLTILLISILISIIIKKDWQLYNISVLFYIITAIVIATLIKFESFKKIYINIMLILAIVSLLTTYVAKPILMEIKTPEELERFNLIITNSSNYKFLNLGLGFAMFQKDYIRNYGIYTEPSFYQFYLTIAIVMILFLKNKINKKDWGKLAIFTITMFTTFSAAAMVILACLLLLYTTKLLYNNRKNKKNITIIVLVCLLIFTSLISIKSTRKVIISTYKKITTVNESSNSRYGSLWYTVEKTIQSPIIGNKIAEISTYDGSITNTTFAISAIYGIIPLFYSLFFTFKFARSNKKNSIKLSLAITLIIILSYNSHFYVGVQSFWMLLLSNLELNSEGEKNENSLDS